MRHFLQRFAPGADRFEGVETFTAPNTNCPVLSGSIAYMVCKVSWARVICQCRAPLTICLARKGGGCRVYTLSLSGCIAYMVCKVTCRMCVQARGTSMMSLLRVITLHVCQLVQHFSICRSSHFNNNWKPLSCIYQISVCPQFPPDPFNTVTRAQSPHTLSHLQVVSRLETPDHWVTYCEVVDGSVMNAQARTAVHRRKIGNYY